MGSYLVIGAGRFGSSVATELYQMKHDVLVIDDHEDSAATIANQVTEVIIGDTKDESVLRSLDIYSFDCVIVAIAGTIEVSVLATMILKELGAKMIVCKAQNELHAKILKQLGADRIIRPEHDMGKRVARSLVRRNTIDYLELSPDYSIMEMLTPMQWAEKSLANNNLRRKYGITIIAVRHGETGKMSFSLSADAVVHEGDVLTVIGTKKELDAISALK
jgi:trk system potassium uptake protein TrkA